MKVLLKDFLRIVNNGGYEGKFNDDCVIDGWTKVYEKVYDEDFDCYDDKFKGEIQSLNINDYMDYEVVNFYTVFNYGELDETELFLKKA